MINELFFLFVCFVLFYFIYSFNREDEVAMD